MAFIDFSVETNNQTHTCDEPFFANPVLAAIKNSTGMTSVTSPQKSVVYFTHVQSRHVLPKDGKLHRSVGGDGVGNAAATATAANDDGVFYHKH